MMPRAHTRASYWRQPYLGPDDVANAEGCLARTAGELPMRLGARRRNGGLMVSGTEWSAGPAERAGRRGTSRPALSSRQPTAHNRDLTAFVSCRSVAPTCGQVGRGEEAMHLLLAFAPFLTFILLGLHLFQIGEVVPEHDHGHHH